MIERRSNRRARNGRKTPKNVLFVFQNCTFRFADYICTVVYLINTFFVFVPIRMTYNPFSGLETFIPLIL